MRRPILVVLAVVLVAVAGCSKSDPTSKPSAAMPKAQANAPTTNASVSTKNHHDSSDKGYSPPTADEMAAMRPAYMAELAKIHEPPEMVNKPMQVREAVSPRMIKLENVMNAVGSPEKATHQPPPCIRGHKVSAPTIG